MSVISLDDEEIVGLIFKGIRQSAATRQDLRRQIFRYITKSTKLQHMFLDALSKQSDIQRLVLQELAKNPRLKRKLVVVAHEFKKSKAGSDS